ncbi:TPA: hypothetical protein NEW61_004939, partial [Escherichia coli]|nr:hypothetical protein [Escherichia coli]
DKFITTDYLQQCPHKHFTGGWFYQSRSVGFVTRKFYLLQGIDKSADRLLMFQGTVEKTDKIVR